ncbi:hypothetical protein ACIPXV_09220 [Streptomyces libani]|uniref:hypothetical protein n=1 Tax=Streptomyces nigrescens TaxID=1920 RepID=UPI00381F5EB1
MTTAVREAPHHRNLTCVKDYRCKRPECVARSYAYDRRRYRMQGYGTWQPLVDATPARQHIDALRGTGHSLPDIQCLARVSAATLARILYDGVNKRSERVRAEVSDRILSIPLAPAPIKPSSIIDATGTRRRLQALVAMGWTLTAIGPHLGFHPRRLTDLLHGERVLASTARRIADGYRIVQTWDPKAHGVSEVSIAKSRKLAARAGWHGPFAWDDNIDDPSAMPEETTPYESTGKYERDPDRKREIEHLYLLGESVPSIAKQLGGSEKYIENRLGAILRERAERAQQERDEAARSRQALAA